LADFIAYQERVDRVKSEDGRVALSPDRWQSLVAYLDPLDTTPGVEQITVGAPLTVNDVLYLPAMYHAA
jgi:hypothetical protein